MKYWLLKTEPVTFGIEHLEQQHAQITPWEGVRNYQARNFIREMSKDDLGFFYHSSCKVPGIVAIVKIVTKAYPDETAFDPNSAYFDEKSHPDNPRWYRVDVQLIKRFDHIVTLTQLRQRPKLKDMILLKPGNRLSVMPVTTEEWLEICKMAENESQSE